MVGRTHGGFDPSRGGRRARSGPQKRRKAGGFLLRFALVVAAGTALLWLTDRPVEPEKIGADIAVPQPGLGAG